MHMTYSEQARARVLPRTPGLDRRELELAAEGADNADVFFEEWFWDDMSEARKAYVRAATIALHIRNNQTHCALLDAWNAVRAEYVRECRAYAKGHYRRMAIDELGGSEAERYNADYESVL